MDEFLDLFPAGPWIVGAVALLALPGVRKRLRSMAKNTIKLGMALTDRTKALVAETREQAIDLYQEAKAEYAEAQAHRQARRTRPSPGRDRVSEATEPKP